MRTNTPLENKSENVQITLHNTHLNNKIHRKSVFFSVFASFVFVMKIYMQKRANNIGTNEIWINEW